MASFASQRCLSVSVTVPQRRQGCTHPAHVRSPVAPRLSGRVIVKAGLGDMLDIGRNDRKALLHAFYHDLDMQKLAGIMADDFRMSEDGGSKVYTKQDYLGILGAVLAAVPDFRWGAATNAETDKDGYAIVTVTATGHHTGAPLQLPGLEPVPASGKHFCLAEEVQKVKVTGDKIKEIVVLPTKGAGPRALYQVLGGKLPVSSTAGSSNPPMP